MSEKKVKIMFSVSERTKADFKIRLQHDSMTQVKFFNSIMEGYLEKDEDFDWQSLLRPGYFIPKN